jgi:hypothetical protein
MVATSHSEGHRYPPGNSGRLYQRGWGRSTVARFMGTWRGRRRTAPVKTGHRGDHRFWRGVGLSADLSESYPDAVVSIGAAPLNAAADPANPKPAIAVTTDFGVAPAEEVTAAPLISAGSCAMHQDAIELGLPRGRNAMAIWQDLVDARGFTGGYQSVKRFVRKMLGNPSKDACAVIQTAPGEEAQVDYGTGPMARDPVSGTGVLWD